MRKMYAINQLNMLFEFADDENNLKRQSSLVNSVDIKGEYELDSSFYFHG